MNWNLLLWAAIGVAVVFLLDWNKQGKNFKPNASLPWYGVSFVIGAILSAFIDTLVVQRLLVFFSVLAFIHIYNGLRKVGAGTPDAIAYGRSINGVAKKGFMEKIFLNPWFGFMVLFGLLAPTAFFQINSAWADAHHFNGLIGWLGIGIVLSIACLVCGWKANATSTGKGG